jgi:hypothetical protein
VFEVANCDFKPANSLAELEHERLRLTASFVEAVWSARRRAQLGQSRATPYYPAPFAPEQSLAEFERRIVEDNEVMACYLTTGDSN